MRFPSILSPAGTVTFAILTLLYTAHASQTLNTTATGTDLQTWWHDNGEVNFDTAVEEGNVRQSHLYSSWVSSLGASDDEILYVVKDSSQFLICSLALTIWNLVTSLLCTRQYHGMDRETLWYPAI